MESDPILCLQPALEMKQALEDWDKNGAIVSWIAQRIGIRSAACLRKLLASAQGVRLYQYAGWT